MRVICPKCQRRLEGGELNVATGAACCRGCGEYFALPSPVAATSGFEASRAVRLDERTGAVAGGSLVLAHRAPSGTMFWTMIMALVLIIGFHIGLSFLIHELHVWFVEWRGEGSPEAVSSILLRSFPAFAGWGYASVAMVLNETRASLDRQGLEVTSGPLPVPFGRWRMPLHEVLGFELTRKFELSGPTWRVWVRSARGRRKSLWIVRDEAEGQAKVDALMAHLTTLRASAPRAFHQGAAVMT